MRSRRARLAGGAIFLLLLLTTPVAAQPGGDTFAAKSVAMIIGFGPGGGYDLWGRTVGRHIGRHLPGAPTVTPQNMPGAGSYAAASYIFNIAPKDGSVLGIIARDAALGPLSGGPARASIRPGCRGSGRPPRKRTCASPITPRRSNRCSTCTTSS